MDAEYLKASVGGPLAEGLAQVSIYQPDDPVDFLAKFLLKHDENTNAKAKLEKQKKKREKSEDKAAVKAEEAARLKEEEEKNTGTQTEKEEKRLRSVMESAENLDRLYDAVLAFLRFRTGASAYIAVCEQPEAPAGAEGEEPPPPADDGEEAPPPKAADKVTFVAATANDSRLMVGKVMTRPVPEEPTEEEEPEDGEAPKPKLPAVGQGVIFEAMDNCLAGVAPYMHISDAISDSRMKFFYIPRKGAYLCVPYKKPETGELLGCLCLDTLGLFKDFEQESIDLVVELSESFANAVDRITKAQMEKLEADRAAMSEEWDKGQAALDEEIMAAADDEESIERAKEKRAKDDVLKVEKTFLSELKGYKLLAEENVKVLRAVFMVLGYAQVAGQGWDAIRAELGLSLPWGQDLLNKVNDYDPLAVADDAVFAPAKAELEGMDEEKIKYYFVVFLLQQFAKQSIAIKDWKDAKDAPPAEEGEGDEA